MTNMIERLERFRFDGIRRGVKEWVNGLDGSLLPYSLYHLLNRFEIERCIRVWSPSNIKCNRECSCDLS
jgi:hypothetical protein